MIFGEYPLSDSEGLLLAHSMRLPDRVLKKGHQLGLADIQDLSAAGIGHVQGARLGADDMDENIAAGTVAAALCASGIVARAPNASRCNLYSTAHGLTTVDNEVIDRINQIGESVTVATLPPLTVVRKDAIVATVKVIPLAVNRSLVNTYVTEAGNGIALGLLPFQSRRAALIVTQQSGEARSASVAVVNSARHRLENLGSHLGLVQYCEHRGPAVARALTEAIAAGCKLILVSGIAVPKDRADTVPAAIVAAGGEIVQFGMPVEPGNMLLLARLGNVPVIVQPGCARSLRNNGIDWVLQRIHAGLPMGAEQIRAMGVGGLIRNQSDSSEQEAVADIVPPRAQPGRNIAALVLAAGSSSRMGNANKLLQEIGGVPMARRVVNAALASRCTSVLVVTGFSADNMQACLAGLDVKFEHNPDYLSGMASSLRRGLAVLGDDVDAVVVLLADMPCIDGGHIDRLIDRFESDQPKIIVPMKNGRRGNPVIWPRIFFAEMKAVEGDVGARGLLSRHPERVSAVNFDDDAIFADIDTPAALDNLLDQSLR